MAIDPLIARGYQGGIANAFMEGQQNARRNTLASLQAQQMQGELDDDAEWDRAFAAKDVGTMMKLDPDATQAIVQHWQQQAMTGLGEIPITRQKIDEKAIFDRGMKEREFAAERQDRDRTYRLNAAQEARLSRPQAGNGDLSFAEYEALPPERKVAYDQFKGRSTTNSPPGPGEVAPTGGVPGFGNLPTGAKLTEVQGKNYLGTSILAENIPVLAAALKEGYSPTRQDLYAVGPPLKGAFNTLAQELTPREKANPKANGFFNAGSKILTAILRPESGGAITEDEWTMYGPMYLPWPGDSPEDVTRKMASLNAYMRRLAQVSGPASGAFTGTAEKGASPADAPAEPPSFATEAEAEAAARKGWIVKGSRVVIGGVPGTWQ